MDTVFSDWKDALQNLQDSVTKDLEEIRKQKAEAPAEPWWSGVTT